MTKEDGVPRFDALAKAGLRHYRGDGNDRELTRCGGDGGVYRS